jgi:hypothetical protein
MDGKKMDDMKRWKCEDGHVLGVIERVPAMTNQGRVHITRLMLFRAAVSVDDGESLGDVEVFGRVEGTMQDIRCSCCGRMRTWWIGADALERFIEKRSKGNVAKI